MKAVPHRLRYALSACAVAGIRVTPDRRHLLERLADTTVPAIVEDLVRDLATTTGGHVVTFYRFITQLEDHGVVHRILLRQRRAVLLSCEAIDYLICVRCGTITQIPEPELRAWQANLALRTGFRLARHWHELAGICPECQAGPQ